MSVTITRDLTIAVTGLGRFQVTGESTKFVPTSEGGTLNTHTLLASLETVCDNLRTSLHWQKTKWGHVKTNGLSASSGCNSAPSVSTSPSAAGSTSFLGSGEGGTDSVNSEPILLAPSKIRGV